MRKRNIVKLCFLLWTLGSIVRSFWEDEQVEVLGEGMEALRPFPIAAPGHFFHLAAAGLYPFIIKW